MNKILKQTISVAVLLLVILPVGFFALAKPAKALNLWGDSFSNNVGFSSFNDIGLGNKDPRTIVAGVINIALGLLGVLAVILILFGGFKWMTAAGNEDNVADAKKILGAGVIGLLIVLSAYAVSIYIIRSYLSATGATSDTTGYELNTTPGQ